MGSYTKKGALKGVLKEVLEGGLNTLNEYVTYVTLQYILISTDINTPRKTMQKSILNGL